MSSMKSVIDRAQKPRGKHTQLELLGVLVHVLDKQAAEEKATVAEREARVASPEAVVEAIGRSYRSWGALHAWFPERQWSRLAKSLESLERDGQIYRDGRSLDFQIGENPDAVAYDRRTRLAASRRIDPKLQRLIKLRDLAQAAEVRVNAGKPLSLADRKRAAKRGVHSVFSRAMNAAERVWQYEQRLLKK